jgi:ACT domain-containing protein
MKAVISVIGKDKVGIMAAVSNRCAEYNVNIIDVSQTVMQGMFTMIMLVDISEISVKFGDFAEESRKYGEKIGMDIRVMHEDIFNSMHRI